MKIENMGNKLMIKLVVGSEAIFFLSLIMAYLYFWREGQFRQLTTHVLHLRTSAIFTFLLISSSFTYIAAENSFKEGKHKNFKWWLTVTIMLGLIFLAGQGHEYFDLIRKQVTINRSEFGSSFYTLTGFHGLHVLIGLIILLMALVVSWTGKQKVSPSLFSTLGWYWHFVDVVWIVVFTIVYVLPYTL